MGASLLLCPRWQRGEMEPGQHAHLLRSRADEARSSKPPVVSETWGARSTRGGARGARWAGGSGSGGAECVSPKK